AAMKESRWPPAIAVLVFMGFNIAVRAWLEPGLIEVPWLMPALEGLLVIVLLTSNPTSASEHRRLRRVAVVLVAVLVSAALWATGVLVADLIAGRGVSNDPSRLLAAAGIVWLGNN